MSDSFSDERADMASNTHLVIVGNGTVVPLTRNDMYIQVKRNSTSTSITTTPPSAVPIGMRMTFDNTNGSGTLSVNSGEVTVPPGLVYEAKVSGDGLGSQKLDLIGPAETPNTLTTLAALQSAIDNDGDNGRRLQPQGGDTPLTTTLDVDGSTGGGLFGLARNEVTDTSGEGFGSTLIYTGSKASNEAAIHFKRNSFVLQDLAIQGETNENLFAGTGTKTPRGIFIDSEPGEGTGKLNIRNVRLSGFGTAIYCAANLGDAGCDESAYYSLLINFCDTGFQSNNIQGLSHKFYDLRCGNVDTIFDYYAGGKLAVTDCFLATECTLLQLRNDNVTGFGHNTSRWVFRGVDLDSNARNSYLLKCESGIDYNGMAIFDGVHLAMNGSDVWDNPGIHVGDNMTVIVNNALNIPANFVSWATSGNTSTVIFNNPKVFTNVTTAADIFKTSGSTGNLRCIVNTGFRYNTYALLGVTPDSGVLYNQVLAGT